MKLTGLNIWVTGAGRGIGRDMALQLSQRGNHVIASSRSEDELRALKLDSQGAIDVLPLDVADGVAMTTAAKALIGLTGKLDLVIINAGACEYIDIARDEIEKTKRMIDVNFLGSIRTFDAALPLLRRSADARVVVVSSLSTVVAFGRAEAYGASKAALEYYFRAAEIDLKPLNIAVTVVRPGFIKTQLTAGNDFGMPFLMESEVAAQHILKGIERRKRLIAFPFQLRAILGLARCFSSTWYRHIAPGLAAGKAS